MLKNFALLSTFLSLALASNLDPYQKKCLKDCVDQKLCLKGKGFPNSNKGSTLALNLDRSLFCQKKLSHVQSLIEKKLPGATPSERTTLTKGQLKVKAHLKTLQKFEAVALPVCEDASASSERQAQKKAYDQFLKDFEALLKEALTYCEKMP
jgi:hypothetical protein